MKYAVLQTTRYKKELKKKLLSVDRTSTAKKLSDSSSVSLAMFLIRPSMTHMPFAQGNPLDVLTQGSVSCFR